MTETLSDLNSREKPSIGLDRWSYIGGQLVGNVSGHSDIADGVVVRMDGSEVTIPSYTVRPYSSGRKIEEESPLYEGVIVQTHDTRMQLGDENP